MIFERLESPAPGVKQDGPAAPAALKFAESHGIRIVTTAINPRRKTKFHARLAR
jgi:hypothetical protein